MEDIKVNASEGNYDESPEAFLEVTIPESDEAFNERMNAYKTEKASYDKWYKANQSVIVVYETAKKQLEDHMKKLRDEKLALMAPYREKK